MLGALERSEGPSAEVAGGSGVTAAAGTDPGAKTDAFELAATLSAGEPSAKATARRNTRQVYRQKLAHYAITLGLEGKDPERKLKRWIERGRRATPEPDYPPFDEPWLMAAWWERNMEWRVPDFLEKLRCEGPPAAGEAAAPAEPKPPAAAAAEEPAPGAGKSSEPPPMPMPEFNVDGGVDHDAEAGVRQLRAFARGFVDEMNRARELKDERRFWSAFERFEKTMEKLRRWEKDLVGIQESRGEVLKARDLNEVLSHIFGVMSLSFTSALMALGKEVAPGVPAEQLRAAVYSHRDKCFAHIKQSRFAKAYEQPAAA